MIQIVKTKYSAEPRSGEQLASLVPRIAPSIAINQNLAEASPQNIVKSPANVDNTIITKSNQRIIETLDKFGKPVHIPYFNRNDERRFMCKAKETKVLLNGEIFIYQIPILVHSETHLAISPIKNN